MEVLDRLNQALQLAGHKIGYSKKSEIASFLGYKLPYYSGIINGKGEITESFLKRISDLLGIDTNWVLTGEGHALMNESSVSVCDDGPLSSEPKSVPYFLYTELLKKYEAVVRENEQLRIKLSVNETD